MHVLDYLVDGERPGPVADAEVEVRFVLVLNVDRVVAGFDGDLTDVPSVDLVEVDGQERRGRRLAEIADEQGQQVQLESVAVLLPDRSVVGGEAGESTRVVDADEEGAAGRVQESGQGLDDDAFERLVDAVFPMVPAQARLELQRLALTCGDQPPHAVLVVGVDVTGQPTGDELVHGFGQQVATGREEIEEVLGLPERAIHRHRLRPQGAGLVLLDLRQILRGGSPLMLLGCRLLQESAIGYCVGASGVGESRVLEHTLRKDVMAFLGEALPHDLVVDANAGEPVAGVAMPGHHVAQASHRRVDARAVEVVLLEGDTASLPHDGRFELVRRVDVTSRHQRHVLLEFRFARPRVAGPEAGEVDPADEPPLDGVGRELSALPRQIDGGRHQHVVGRQVVEAADERLVAEDVHQVLEGWLHFPPRVLQRPRGRLHERAFEHHRAGRHPRETAHQEVEIDVEAALRHLGAEAPQLRPGLRPQAAHVRQREVRLLQGRPSAVDPIEDVHDLADAVIVAGDLIDGVGVVAHLVELAQPGQVLLHDRAPVLVHLVQPFEQRVQPLPEEVVDADPGRVVLHERLLPEPELLGLHVEVQIEEQRLALVELGGCTLEQHVQRRQALLPVEQQQRVPVVQRLAAAHQRWFVRAPDQQVSGGVLPVERLHQPPHLVLVPDVAALELGQQNLVAADLAQQILNRPHLVHRILSCQGPPALNRRRQSTARLRLSARAAATSGRQRSVAYSVSRDV